MADFIKSHLVSQVVLRQFAVKKTVTKSDGKKKQVYETIVHTKETDITELCDVENVAYLEVAKEVIAELEQQWSHDIEKDAKSAINSIVNNNWTDKHIGVIKDLMALHFIRSQAFALVGNNLDYIVSGIKARKDEIIAVYPEYTDAINQKYEEEIKKAPLDVAIGILKTYIAKTKEFLADKELGLEVGEAPDGVQFVIGDVPVITMDRSRRVVPITEANYVAMPITPKYIVALKKTPDKKKAVKLTKENVESANSKQVGISLNNYFSLPE